MANSNSRSLIIILVISGLVIFVLGGVVGVLYQNQKTGGTILPSGQGQPVESTKASGSVKSAVVTSVVLFGQVKSISGKTLVIANNGDTAQVTVSSETKIFTVDYTSGAPVQKNAQFANIKVGATVNIGAKVLNNDTFSAQSVTIYITK